MSGLIEELQWRGLVQDIIPGTEEQVLKESTTAYIGFDPTADSLHVGSFVQIILLKHLFNFGHTPIALIGGATGMIGDPSGKSNERNLLDENTLNKNVEGIKKVLQKFLDFNSKEKNAPLLVNNYEWMKKISFIDFVREVGKRITVNYMMSKDSVKKRIEGEGEGMSFTEFTYQLLQGYDFYYLYKNYHCLLQVGGSDQWGNITTGTELIRRINVNNLQQSSQAYAFTTPLITKTDGTKFGKTESGNIWLDAEKTSVYQFYQFWLNTTDVDAEKYIKIFTFLTKNDIENILKNQIQEPHLRHLQKKLAEEVTTIVHGEEELHKAQEASSILFGNSSKEKLQALDHHTFLTVFEGVPQKEITKSEVLDKPIVEILSEISGFLSSKSEATRSLKENSISVNQERIPKDYIISEKDIINNTFILLQKGKKNYYILIIK